MIRRTLFAAAVAAAVALDASGQGLRQVGTDDFGMTVEDVHPTADGIRVRVLIENLTQGKEIFLHHEANQLNAKDFFYIYAARRNASPRRDTYLLPITPLGTASADLFFPLEAGANPGLLVLGSPRPPFRQVAVALGAILKGDQGDKGATPSPADLISPTTGPVLANPATARPIMAAARSSPAVVQRPVARPPTEPPQTAAPQPEHELARTRAQTGGAARAQEPSTPWTDPVPEPPVETIELAGAPAGKPGTPPTVRARQISRPPATSGTPGVPRPAATPGAPRPAATPGAPTPRPPSVAAARGGAPPRPAPRWTTPAGAPPQTEWIPVDESPARPDPEFTTPAGAPPQTRWIPIDDEPVTRPAPPGPPPVTPVRPGTPGQAGGQAGKPAASQATAPAAGKTAAPRAASQPARPQAGTATQAPRPRVVFVANTPGDRILQIFTPPHVSLGKNLVLRQGKPGNRGYGWARIMSEHPGVQVADIARAATYPHQVWSDGRTLLYLRWSEDQNGAMVLQVAGDLIVTAQWATYDELLYWLGPGHIYTRLMYQGAR